MRTARLVLALTGLAGLGWGATLLIQFAAPAPDQAVVAAGWLLGGPLVHDLLIAPAAALAALAIGRVAPTTWHTPLKIALATSAVLALLAVPLLWRANGTPPLPGLHDHNPVPGFLIALAVIWVIAAVAGVLRHLRSRRNVVRHHS